MILSGANVCEVRADHPPVLVDGVDVDERAFVVDGDVASGGRMRPHDRFQAMLVVTCGRDRTASERSESDARVGRR